MTSDPIVARLTADRSGPPAHVIDRVRAAAVAEGLVDVAWTTTDTPVGPLLLATTDAGLVRISFDGDEAMLDDLASKVSPRVVEAPARLDDVRRQLDEYFAGPRHEFDLPIDRSLSSAFYRRVLEALCEVPYGQTVNYMDLARTPATPAPAGRWARPCDEPDPDRRALPPGAPGRRLARQLRRRRRAQAGPPRPRRRRPRLRPANYARPLCPRGPMAEAADQARQSSTTGRRIDSRPTHR